MAYLYQDYYIFYCNDKHHVVEYIDVNFFYIVQNTSGLFLHPSGKLAKATMTHGVNGVYETGYFEKI